MPKSVLRAVLGRMQFTLHATRRTPHGASRLVQAMSAWLVKTRRAPSRHSRDAKVYGHTTTAVHKLNTPPRPLAVAIQTSHPRRFAQTVSPWPSQNRLLYHPLWTHSWLCSRRGCRRARPADKAHEKILVRGEEVPGRRLQRGRPNACPGENVSPATNGGHRYRRLPGAAGSEREFWGEKQTRYPKPKTSETTFCGDVNREGHTKID